METVVLPIPLFWLETVILTTLRRELCRKVSFGLPHRKSFLHDVAAEGTMKLIFTVRTQIYEI